MNIAFHTLGCKLNFSETSFIANEVKEAGLNQVHFNEKADIYVINTCSVTENANKECQYLIRKVLKKNPNARTVIMGCYAQLKPQEIIKIKGVDLVLGNNEKFKLTKYLNELKKIRRPKIIKQETSNLTNFHSAFSKGDRTRSFLKIQDGCNYKCTFCTIPIARGKSRSDEIDKIIEKIETIKKDNIKEIVLTGVNIGDFQSNNRKFIDLLREIDKIKDIRIRISSIEPNLISDEIINLVSKSEVLLPHFHIPLQSGSDYILTQMKRRYLTKHYRNVIEKINTKIENACIGVDIIVGFPGETEQYFEETVSFLKSLHISYLHVFTYSERENTEAILMNQDIVPKQARKYRSQVLRNLSDKKQQAFYEKNIGSLHEVLFESKKNDEHIYGFSKNYIKIKSKYHPDLQNTLKKVKISAIEHSQTTCATGLLI